MRTRVISLLAVTFSAACASGSSYNSVTNPGDSNPAPTTPNTINANPAITYNPGALTIAKGTTVTFNFGSLAHSVTFTSPGSPASIPVSSNTSASVTFPDAGTFNFHCTVHNNMFGVITVQ